LSMSRVFSLIAILIVGIFVYLLPGLAEWTLIGNHLSPWFSCVIFGDLVGCAILFLRGYRRSAMAIYILCSVAETVLLTRGTLSPEQLVWVTNLIPAVVVAVTVVKTGKRNLQTEEK
jgi:hypothetical protein